MMFCLYLVVYLLIYDLSIGKVSGVRVIDGEIGEQYEFFVKVIFFCVLVLGSMFIFMNIVMDEYFDGFGSSSG